MSILYLKYSPIFHLIVWWKDVMSGALITGAICATHIFKYRSGLVDQTVMSLRSELKIITSIMWNRRFKRITGRVTYLFDKIQIIIQIYAGWWLFKIITLEIRGYDLCWKYAAYKWQKVIRIMWFPYNQFFDKQLKFWYNINDVIVM